MEIALITILAAALLSTIGLLATALFRIMGRFDAIDGRFDAIAGQFDVVAGRFDRLVPSSMRGSML